MRRRTKTVMEQMDTENPDHVLANLEAKNRYAKYLAYIKNAGGNPTVEWFDEDWEPIGPQVRKEMEAAGLARVIEGRIYVA